MGEIERVHRLGSLPALPRVGDRQRGHQPRDHEKEKREDSIELSVDAEDVVDVADVPGPDVPVEEPYRLDLEA